MACLTPKLYYLDDWDIIKSNYETYIKEHSEQLDRLQKWMKHEPHLPVLPKHGLAKMLRLANDSPEVAKELIDSFFTYKTRSQEMFTNRLQNNKKVEQILDLVEVAAPDPWELSIRGCRLTFARIVDTDPSKLFFHEGMQIFLAAMDYEVARIAPAAKGIIGIMDMDGLQLGHIARINIMDVAVTLKYIQIFDQFVHEVYVINCNNLIQSILTMARPFLSKSLASKLNFYTPSQMEEFYQKIPKSYVPSTYGGHTESMAEQNKKFRERFRGAEDFISEMDSPKYHVKENLRKGCSGPQVMSGSFRKLCID